MKAISNRTGYAPDPTCQNLYGLGTGAVTFGIAVWNHNGSSAASVGGAFYSGTQYPAAYQGAYFYGDYGQSVINTLTSTRITISSARRRSSHPRPIPRSISRWAPTT